MWLHTMENLAEDRGEVGGRQSVSQGMARRSSAKIGDRMESQRTLRAWTLMKGRRPRQFEDIRGCADTTCHTTLSRYNSGPYCYNHSPVRYPRNRGVASEA